MIQIKKAQPKDYKILSKLSISSFITAHGNSGPKKDIDNYIFQNFSEQNVLKELKEIENHFYLIFIIINCRIF